MNNKIAEVYADKFMSVLLKNKNNTEVGARAVVKEYNIEGTDRRVKFDGYCSRERSMVTMKIMEKNGTRYSWTIDADQVRSENMSDIYYGMVDFIARNIAE